MRRTARSDDHRDRPTKEGTVMHVETREMHKPGGIGAHPRARRACTGHTAPQAAFFAVRDDGSRRDEAAQTTTA
jgi:hypothetical protein